MRIGHGYDAHRFADGERLVLGGVDIPFDKGLAAHSDGDVALHALCDALIGAAGGGDIGKHFPDSDPQYKNIDSRVLLRSVIATLGEQGLTVVRRIKGSIEAGLDGDVGVSVGLIAFKPAYSAEEFLRLADEAMYDSKKHRGGEIVCR